MRRILLPPLWCRDLNRWQLISLFLLAWGGQFVSSQLLMGAFLAAAGEDNHIFLTWCAVLLSEILGIVILLAGWKNFLGRNRMDMRLMRSKEWKLALLGLGIAVLGSGALSAEWEFVLEFFDIPYSEEQEVVDMFRNSGVYGKILIGFTAVAVVPFFEELLFRRTLFAFFARWGNLTAMILTSVIFGAVHFFLLGLPALCWLGFVFQALYLRSRNVFVSTAAHAMLNFCALFVALLQTIFPNFT